jgi:hypothetical protein
VICGVGGCRTWFSRADARENSTYLRYVRRNQPTRSAPSKWLNRDLLEWAVTGASAANSDRGNYLGEGCCGFLHLLRFRKSKKTDRYG